MREASPLDLHDKRALAFSACIFGLQPWRKIKVSKLFTTFRETLFVITREGARGIKLSLGAN